MAYINDKKVITSCYSGNQPKLFKPAVAINGNTLTITDTQNGAFTVSYRVYAYKGLTQYPMITTTNKTITQIQNYFVDSGTYYIRCVAIATNFQNSNVSNNVPFTR